MLDLLLAVRHFDLGLPLVDIFDPVGLLHQSAVVRRIVNLAFPKFKCLTVALNLLLHLFIIFH